MSDTTETNETNESQRATLASMLMGVALGPESTDEGTEAANGRDAQEAAAEMSSPGDTGTGEQAQEENPATGEQTDGEEVPTWPGQQEAGRAFAGVNRAKKEAEDAARKAEAEAAYWRGLAEGRTPPKAAEPAKVKTDEDPQPDPDTFTDDAKYFDALRDWDRRQAKKEVLAELGPEVADLKEYVAQQAWDASMSTAQAAAGESWSRVVAFVTQMREVSPSFDADLNAARNPGAFVLNAYRSAAQALGQPASVAVSQQNPNPQATPTTARPGAPVDANALINDPAHQQAVLRAIAAQKAAQGVIPSVPTGPRGVGSGPGAAGVSDLATTVESIRSTTNPNVLRKEQGKAMAAWLGDSFAFDE